MRITINVPGGDTGMAIACMEQVADAIKDLERLTEMDWSRKTRFDMRFPTTAGHLVDGWWKVEP